MRHRFPITETTALATVWGLPPILTILVMFILESRGELVARWGATGACALMMLIYIGLTILAFMVVSIFGHDPAFEETDQEQVKNTPPIDNSSLAKLDQEHRERVESAIIDIHTTMEDVDMTLDELSATNPKQAEKLVEDFVAIEQFYGEEVLPTYQQVAGLVEGPGNGGLFMNFSHGVEELQDQLADLNREATKYLLTAPSSYSST